MRLIDADILLERLPVVKKDREISLIGAVADFVIMICDTPTVDAVPIRHGLWEVYWDEEYYQYLHHCSVCGSNALTKEETMHDEVLSRYCPYCGARMDDEERLEILMR